jgi:hypothetical protein
MIAPVGFERQTRRAANFVAREGKPHNFEGEITLSPGPTINCRYQRTLGKFVRLVV